MYTASNDYFMLSAIASMFVSEGLDQEKVTAQSK